MVRLPRIIAAASAPPRIWVSVAVVAMIAAFVTAWAAPRPATIVLEGGLPTWALVLAFAGAHALILHVEFRRDSHSFTLFELVLVVGLLATEPADLLLAAAVGGSLSMAGINHQPIHKLLFNLGSILIQTVVALVVFDGLVSLLGRSDLAIWASASMGVVVGATVGLVLVTAIIGLAELSFNFGKSMGTIYFGLVVVFTNVSTGLTGWLLYQQHPAVLLALVAPIAAVAGSYRALGNERAQRERIEHLQAATAIPVRSKSRGVETLLLQVAEMFRCQSVELVMVTADRQGAVRQCYDATTDSFQDSPEAELVPVVDRAAETYSGASLVIANRDPVLGRYLTSSGATEALAAVIRVGDEAVGIILGRDREGKGKFTGADVRLFDTLASYVAANFENGELERALVAQREVEAELSHQANHDALTGLPNRAQFNRVIAEVAAGSEPWLLTFVDLDDFKPINDTYGHAAGDEVLRQVAIRISSCLRDEDLVARLGGDEFAAVVRSTVEAEELGERILATVREPFEFEGHTLSPACSIGVTSIDAVTDADAALEVADLAMYEAKSRGKNTVVVRDLAGHGASARSRADELSNP